MILEAVEKSFATFQAWCESEGLTSNEFKAQFLQAKKICQGKYQFEGNAGKWVVIILMIGLTPIFAPIFVTDIMAEEIDIRVDWQEHKYRLLTTVGALLQPYIGRF
jgi:hypothetical protein